MSSPAPAPANAEVVEDPSAFKRLRHAIDIQRDLPSINGAPRRLASLTGRDDTRIQDLTEIALADPALALRLIRVANGSAYGNRDRTDVVHIARAMSLLGAEQTRKEARRLQSLEEHVAPNRQQMVRDAIGYASFAAHFARALLDTRNPLVSDEGALTVMMASLPEIVMCLHAPHELAALRYVERHHPSAYDSVNRDLLGRSLGDLGREVVERWALPRSTLDTIARSASRPTPAVNGRDWLSLGVGLAQSVTRALRAAEQHDRNHALQETVRRFHSAMSIDSARLHSLIEIVAQEAAGVENSLGTGSDGSVISRLVGPYLTKEPFEPGYWNALERLDATGTISRLKNRTAMQEDRPRLANVDLNAAGKPVNAAEQLAALLSEIREMIEIYDQGERDGEFAQLSNTPYERVRTRIVPRILHGLLVALGYERVVWFEFRANNEDWLPTAAAGVSVDHMQGLTRTRIEPKNLFGAILRNGIDMHIADCTEPKISHNLPSWFSVLYPSTRSFLIVPVKIEGKAQGFILADRACTDPSGLSDAELALARKLRDLLAGLLEKYRSKAPTTA
ncbi:MAG: HDOD domain-containing protein [Burkholderiaceae bacterium]